MWRVSLAVTIELSDYDYDYEHEHPPSLKLRRTSEHENETSARDLLISGARIVTELISAGYCAISNESPTAGVFPSTSEQRAVFSETESTFTEPVLVY